MARMLQDLLVLLFLFVVGAAAATLHPDDAPIVGFLDYVLNDLPHLRLERCGDPMLEPPSTSVASARSIMDPKAKPTAVLKVCSEPVASKNNSIAQFQEYLASRDFTVGLETYLQKAIPYFLEEQYNMCETCRDACGDTSKPNHDDYNEGDDAISSQDTELYVSPTDDPLEQPTDSNNDSFDASNNSTTVIGLREFDKPLSYSQYEGGSGVDSCGGSPLFKEPLFRGVITSFQAMGDGLFCSEETGEVGGFTLIHVTSCERTKAVGIVSGDSYACNDSGCSFCDGTPNPFTMYLPGLGFAPPLFPDADTCWGNNNIWTRFDSADANVIDAYWQLFVEYSCLKDDTVEERNNDNNNYNPGNINNPNSNNHSNDPNPQQQSDDTEVVDCDSCQMECSMIENMEDNGYIDASLFSTCTLLYDDDDEQLYAGPQCKSEGSKIKIGLFRDKECTIPDLTSRQVDDYLMDGDGNSMRLSYHLLKKAWPSSSQEETCLPCEQLDLCDFLVEAADEFVIEQNPDTTNAPSNNNNKNEETATHDESEAGTLLSSSGSIVLPITSSLLALTFLAGTLVF